MEPNSTIDLMDATVYAVDAIGQYTKLGKIIDNSCRWYGHKDVYEMELNIIGYCEPFKPTQTNLFEPKKIIQNGPAFIVFWNDGTKTILKKKEDNPDDPYAAFGQALMKKIFGTNSKAHKMVDRHFYFPFEKHEKEDTKEKGEEVTEDGRSESDGSGLS